MENLVYTSRRCACRLRAGPPTPSRKSHWQCSGCCLSSSKPLRRNASNQLSCPRPPAALAQIHSFKLEPQARAAFSRPPFQVVKLSQAEALLGRVAHWQPGKHRLSQVRPTAEAAAPTAALHVRIRPGLAVLPVCSESPRHPAGPGPDNDSAPVKLTWNVALYDIIYHIISS